MDILNESVVLEPKRMSADGAGDGHNVAPHDGNGRTAHHDDTEVLKVSAHSRPSAVAGAIAAVIRNQGRADVQAIGAGATNQAIKAVAIARDYLQPDGIDIVLVPAFIDVMIAEEERTAIRLVVEARR